MLLPTWNLNIFTLPFPFYHYFKKAEVLELDYSLAELAFSSLLLHSSIPWPRLLKKSQLYLKLFISNFLIKTLPQGLCSHIKHNLVDFLQVSFDMYLCHLSPCL